MRIGLFSSSLPHRDRKPGGVDVFVDNLGNRLADRGHAVTMFSFSQPPHDAGYGSIRLAPASHAHSKLARLSLVPLALNRLDTSSIDVLHLHGDDWFFVSRRVPTVRTFHGSALQEARTATGFKRRASQFVTFMLEIMSSRLATRSYVLGPLQGASYAPAGVLSDAVEVPPNATMTRSDPPIILFVGTWTGRKRGRLLYEAFHRDVLPRVPSAQLHMVSDECPEGANVRWWDRPSKAELDNLYRRAWVFCLPSTYEGFGLPYAEAMAAGTPVVSTANPGAIHVLDRGRAGLIVSERELGHRLFEVLTNPDLRLSLARSGRVQVRRFDWAPTIEAHERAYQEAIAAWQTRRLDR